MIDIRIDPPKTNTMDMTPEEQLADLRTYVANLAETMNSILEAINQGTSFGVKMAGTPEQIARGQGVSQATSSRPIDMGGMQIRNLGMPSEPGDAASMQYVLTIFNKEKGA